MEEKYKVLKAINSGKKQAEVAQRFDPPLSQSTVATIVRSKKEIISAYEAGLYKDKRKRMKQPSYPDVEKALAEWFKKVRSINVPVNGPLLAEKARYFAEQLGYENFKASNGFLDRFKERQGITGQNVCGEEKSVDSSVVDTGQNVSQIFAVAMSPEIDIMRTRQAFCGKQLQHKPSILKDKSAVGERTVKNVLLFL